MSRPDLVSLPGEIKNSIIRLAVPTNAHFKLDRRATKSLRGNRSYASNIVPHLHEPALSAVCKELRHDVLSIYYGENTFNITTNWQAATQNSLAALEKALGSRTKSLRSIRFFTVITLEEPLEAFKHPVCCNPEKEDDDGRLWHGEVVFSITLMKDGSIEVEPEHLEGGGGEERTGKDSEDDMMEADWEILDALKARWCCAASWLVKKGELGGTRLLEVARAYEKICSAKGWGRKFRLCKECGMKKLT